MEQEILNNKQVLIDWLSDPHELGHAPEKIEYTNMFEDENGSKCYIFKYQKDSSSKWCLGIVSDSGPFSEMQEYKKETEIMDAQIIHNMLKNYWKQRATEFKKTMAVNTNSNVSTPKITTSENIDNKDNFTSDASTIINNEHDFSNIIPVIEGITYLVQYCDNTYNYFIKLIEEDTTRNEQLKYEYRNYNYKRSFGERFVVSIREKSYNTIECKNFNEFQSVINEGKLKNVNYLEIRMDLDYKRGTGNNLASHENSFKITFKPYEIKFIRNSNHNEPEMNNIENYIKDILNKFPTANSIFCTK